MASKEDHCLLDLLWRNRRGELDMSVAMVISNHPDLADQVRPFGCPLCMCRRPRIFGRKPSNANSTCYAETSIWWCSPGTCRSSRPEFLDEVGCPMINIHHSFLPAFIGAARIERAKERGVKLVGATAHYVTEDLDEGPIIEQDVVRVDHRHGVDDLIRLGADVERACAVAGGAVAL